MAVNPRSNRNADTEHDYAPDARSPAHDMQALLMDLQALGSGSMMREDEHDKIVDKLIMTALYLKSTNRELRVDCLHLAYLFVQTHLNAKLILDEWNLMMPKFERLKSRLTNSQNQADAHCLELIKEIMLVMYIYRGLNVRYNASSSASNNYLWYHRYIPPPSGPPPKSDGSGRYYSYASSIATQENV